MLVPSLLGSRYSFDWSLIPPLDWEAFHSAVQMSRWVSPRAQPVPHCSLLEGASHSGAPGTGNPGAAWLPILAAHAPSPNLVAPAPQGRSLTCRGSSRVPAGRGVVPKGAEAGEPLSGRGSLCPAAPLCLCSLQPEAPAAASAQPSSVPRWLRSIDRCRVGEGARKQCFYS